MIAMHGSAGEGGGAQPGDAAGGGGLEPVDAGVAVHEVPLVPGMSRPELVRSLEGEVPVKARFLEVDGDVDYTLRWQTAELEPLEQLVAEEAAAWREWRDAEDRQHDFARLHRHASDAARLAQGKWHGVATRLARRHPSFDELAGPTRQRPTGPGGTPPGVGQGPTRTEAAAKVMISRMRARAESMQGPVVRPVDADDAYLEFDVNDPSAKAVAWMDDAEAGTPVDEDRQDPARFISEDDVIDPSDPSGGTPSADAEDRPDGDVEPPAGT